MPIHKPVYRLFRGRYRLLAVFLTVGLSFFLLTRLFLLFQTGSAMSGTGMDLIRVFALGGLYDLSFMAYALLPIVFYLWWLPRRWWRTSINRLLVHVLSFLVIYSFGFIAIAELLFWDEFKARFNFIAIDYLIYTHETVGNIYQSYPLISIMLILLVFSVIIYWFVRKSIARALAIDDSIGARTIPASIFMLLPFLVFAGINQDLREIGPTTYHKELASNGPYQFIAAFRNNELDYKRFYLTLDKNRASRQLRRMVTERNIHFSSRRPFMIERHIISPQPERRLNVVLITVESLSAKFLSRFGNSQKLTPNLDRLADKSLFFKHFYATGTRTVRGLEAVTLSIPPTPGRSIVKRIGRESGMWSLGNVLREKGYDVKFLYGGRGYFDNMNAFFRGNGYDIVDQTTVSDDEIHFKNAWGMADEDLYSQVIKYAAIAHKNARPFFFHVMTTSNHRPYTYPEGRISYPSGKSGRKGAVQYTDWAIGDFLRQAQQQPWFADTVFVILADHSASSSGRLRLPLYRYHIPMWIYSPRYIRPREINTISSQIDVAPTLLALLGMSYTSNAFGKDILRMSSREQRALIGNYEHLGFYQHGKLWILAPQKKAVARVVSEEAKPRTVYTDLADQGLQKAISYYQSAAYVYRHHLNAWHKSGP